MPTIHFSDSAKFVVNGGTFTMGNAQYSGSPDITMDAESGSSFKGFEFNGANVYIYNTTFPDVANDSISTFTLINCPVVDIRNNSFTLGSSGNNKGAFGFKLCRRVNPVFKCLYRL